MATLTTSGLERDSVVDERARALRRLEDALEEQARLAEMYRQSVGTSLELDSYVRLREARNRVTACDRWLRWVDDEDAVVTPPADDVPLENVLGH
jgi:hypothetical protein